MSAPPSRRLQALADAMDVHDQHMRIIDGRLISLVGPLGTIRPFHGELQISIQKRTSVALARRLLDSGVLDVGSNGDLKIGRLPRPDEAVTLADLIGVARRRLTTP
jgi:hypothetical protein